MKSLAVACLLVAISFAAYSHESMPPKSLKAESVMTQVAKGTFYVSMKPLSIENTSQEDKLGRMSIDKTISGDLIARTKGQMLTAGTVVQGSAGYVAIEQVSGTLSGRSGTFILQHTATMNRGEPVMDVHVVPDSGTGELTGLEGNFKIQIVDGQHKYEFSYRIADQDETAGGT
jgi:hypothetical protein